MSVFYAFVKNINSDVTYRYLAVFSTRDVADQWWRAVSTAEAPKFQESIKRLTPQYYTHDPSKANVITTITDAKGAPQFADRVMFTLLNDRDGRVLSLAIPNGTRDRISGNTFHIRSKVKPDEFWYVPRSSQGQVLPGTPVTLSTDKRTLFRISRSDPGVIGTVMIGSDNITIVEAVSGALVTLGSGQYLVIGGGSSTFQLADIISPTFRADEFTDRVYQTDNEQGETWEIV